MDQSDKHLDQSKKRLSEDIKESEARLKEDVKYSRLQIIILGLIWGGILITILFK